MSEEEKKAIVLLRELRGLYEATAEDHKFRGTLSIHMDEDDSDAIETLLNLIDKNKKEIEELKEEIEEQNSEFAIIREIHKRDEEIDKQQKEIECLESQLDFIGYKKELHKQKEEIEQLANGIRVLGTNLDITTEEIIKEFTEKPITEEYMEEFKSRYISKDKVLKALGYEENGEEYKRIYNKEEAILSLIHLINEECDRLEDIEDQKTMLEIHNIENQRDKYWEDKIKKTLLKFQNEYGEDLETTNQLFIGKEVIQYGEDMLDEIAKELNIDLLEEN